MAPKAKAAPAAAAPKAKAKAEAKPKAAPAKKVEKKPEDELPKIPVVPQPDKAAFEEKMTHINEAIEKLQKEQGALTTRINERSGGKDEFFAKKNVLRGQMDEFSAKMDELQAKKEEYQKAIGEKVQEGRDMRQQLNKMKKAIGFSSEAEIDDRIATIEFKLWTESLSLKDEKKFLAEIQELKRNRPKVSQVHKMEDSLTTHDQGMSIKEKIALINEEMAKYRESKKKIAEKLTELMESRKEQLGDLPAVIAEREELGKKIGEKIKERNEIRDEYRQAERDYNAYLAELRKIRQEKAMEERKLRQAEYDQRRREREVEKLDEQPYVSEITLIEQTILFCKTLITPKSVEEKEEKKQTEFNNPDGTEVLLKKEDRDEFYFAPLAKKKSAKGKAAGGKESSSRKPIKHNAETFRLFDQLKLDAPITTDDIPATLEKLEAQLESYQNKVKEWEEKREEMKKRILEGAALDDDKEEEAKEEEAKEEEEEAKEEEAKEEEAKEEKEEGEGDD